MQPVLAHEERTKNQNDNIKRILVQMFVDQVFTLLLLRFVANSSTWLWVVKRIAPPNKEFT